MAVVYATLIVKGKKTFADVPAKLKDEVKQILIDLDCADLAQQQIEQVYQGMGIQEWVSFFYQNERMVKFYEY